MDHAKKVIPEILYHYTNTKNLSAILSNGMNMKSIGEMCENYKKRYALMFEGEDLNQIHAAFFWDDIDIAIKEGGVSCYPSPQSLLKIETKLLIDLELFFSDDLWYDNSKPVPNATMVHSRKINKINGQFFSVISTDISKDF